MNAVSCNFITSKKSFYNLAKIVQSVMFQVLQAQLITSEKFYANEVT